MAELRRIRPTDLHLSLIDPQETFKLPSSTPESRLSVLLGEDPTSDSTTVNFEVG